MSMPRVDELEIDNEYLRCAVESMFSVEDIFMESFGEGYDEQKGGHWDVVTAADGEIENRLIEFIKEDYPTSSFVVEEGSDVDTEDTLTWIIDPIDGTMNYSHGVDYCGISIGIEYDSEPLGGVIFLPARDELYYAVMGEGAYRNNTSISTSGISKISNSLIEVDVNPGNVEDLEVQSEIYKNIIRKSQGMRAIRSAVGELTSLADGRVEVVYDSMYHPWDMAGAVPLIREAGGEVYARSSGSTDWNDLKDEEKVIATNGEISYEQLTEEFDS